eukprot:scaffold249072_cov30-Tisochrysis_lutea.AAC.1
MSWDFHDGDQLDSLRIEYVLITDVYDTPQHLGKAVVPGEGWRVNGDPMCPNAGSDTAMSAKAVRAASTAQGSCTLNATPWPWQVLTCVSHVCE